MSFASVELCAGDSEVMQALAVYIAEHYASTLRMSDLARHCHVSVRTLQNLCHAHCGEPPLKVLRRFRLQQLHAVLMQRPWTPMRQHYLACGLTGSVADRDLFLEMYGLTIREHQEASRYKQPPLRVVPSAEAAPRRTLQTYIGRSA